MSDYTEQEKIINSPWINWIDIMKILPIHETTAKKIIHDIIVEMKKNEEFYFSTKPRYIPTNKVVKKYKIDTETIRREARRINK